MNELGTSKKCVDVFRWVRSPQVSIGCGWAWKRARESLGRAPIFFVFFCPLPRWAIFDSSEGCSHSLSDQRTSVNVLPSPLSHSQRHIAPGVTAVHTCLRPPCFGICSCTWNRKSDLSRLPVHKYDCIGSGTGKWRSYILGVEADDVEQPISKRWWHLYFFQTFNQV